MTIESLDDAQQASLAFSKHLRERARAGTITAEADEATVDGTTAATDRRTALMEATGRLEAAQTAGDEARVALANRRIDNLLEAARIDADEHALTEAGAAAQQPPLDFGAGARPARQEPASMTELLRVASGRPPR